MDIINRLQRELNDDESGIKDVTLVGSDGGRVMATKAILAIQSPVFHRLFYGNFREGDKNCDSVNLDYSATVLRAIVTYCYTNGTGFDWLPSGELKGFKLRELSDANIVTVIQVREAANYFELPKLHEDMTAVLSHPLTDFTNDDCAKRHVQIHLLIMEELWTRGETHTKLWFCGKGKNGIWEYVKLHSCGSLAILQELKLREESDWYWWSGHVKKAILEMVLTLSWGYHERLSSSLRLLQSREVTNGKEWTTSIEKAEKTVEIIISCLDNINLNLTWIKVRSSEGAFKDVMILRAFKKAYGSFTSEEEEASFQKICDSINLESIETPFLASIKPCSYFTKDKLYSVLVRQGLHHHERPREKRTRESL